MSKIPKKTKRKTVANIGRNECRWPIGDPRHPDFHFCGAPQVPGRPYCELHWRVAFVPARARQAQPARSSPDRQAA
jgi:GcrA cell cycle regulator